MVQQRAIFIKERRKTHAFRRRDIRRIVAKRQECFVFFTKICNPKLGGELNQEVRQLSSY